MTQLDETMGALFLGVFFSAIFWGISCTQVYYYFNGYPRDRTHMKVIVFAVWASDTVHQALITHSLYTYLITEYGNPSSLALLTRTIVIEVLFNGITGLLVQGFFVLRIWKLSEKNLYLAVPVALLVFAEFGMSVTYFAKSIALHTYADLSNVRDMSICMNVFAAAGDVAIAASLCALLHKSRTNFSKSNTLINKLIVFAVNTGLLTSVCACISLITFFVAPTTFIYICFYFLMGRLYCNSLLATLNARNRLRDNTANDVSVSLRDMQPSANIARGARRGEGIAIRIETTKETDTCAELETDNDSNAGSQKNTEEV